MHLGWIINDDHIVAFAERHGFTPTIDDGTEISPNVYGACVEALNIILDDDEKDGQVPGDPRIGLVFVSDGDIVPNPVEQGRDNFHLAVRVGTNYAGTIPKEHIEKLGAIIAPGVDPKWFLDMERWYWTSRPQFKASKSARTSCTFLSAVVFSLVPDVSTRLEKHKQSVSATTTVGQDRRPRPALSDSSNE